jgi:hypothetical protein
MVRLGWSRVWPRLVASVALGLALVAPAAAFRADAAVPPAAGFIGLVPTSSHAVAAVLRVAPPAGVTDTKHATGGWALGALPIALATALGWLAVRRRATRAPAAAAPRAVAARAPPSTVST